MAGLPPIKALDTGRNYSYAASVAGELWGWGAPDGYMPGPSLNQYQLQKFVLPSSVGPIVDVSVGATNIAVLGADGQVWAWGNDVGLGNSSAQRQVASKRTEWFGRGADRLGLSGALTHETFGAVIRGVHPGTGEVLGRAFQEQDSGGSAPSKRAFDATFSAPKTVSLVWAFGDEATRRELHGGHVAAVKAVVGEIEGQARTRYRLADQSLVCVDAQGLAVGLAHQFTSRTGDPQIHTHAIISSKVQAPDGRWLALDARALMADQQCWSRLYHAALEAELTRRLGVVWGPQTGVGHREMVGVGRDVIDGFSRRTAQAEAAIQQKVADFRVSVGRDPNPNETWRLHREAVVETRPAKHGDLADGFERWGAQLDDEYGIAPAELVAGVVGRVVEPGRHTPETHDATARAVLVAMGEQQSAWRPNQLLRDLARDTAPSAATAVETVTELKAAVRRVLEHECIPVHEVMLPPVQAPLPLVARARWWGSRCWCWRTRPLVSRGACRMAGRSRPTRWMSCTRRIGSLNKSGT